MRLTFFRIAKESRGEVALVNRTSACLEAVPGSAASCRARTKALLRLRHREVLTANAH
jgi:hypothetical protein